jgi:hypothetical protein
MVEKEQNRCSRQPPLPITDRQERPPHDVGGPAPLNVQLVSVVWSGKSAIAAPAADLRTILSVLHGTPLMVQQTVVVQRGNSVLQIFSPIHALAIQLPALRADQALAFLLSHPLVVVDSIAPTPPPSRSAPPGDCSRSRCRLSISSGGAERLGLPTTGAAPPTAVTYPAADL